MAESENVDQTTEYEAVKDWKLRDDCKGGNSKCITRLKSNDDNDADHRLSLHELCQSGESQPSHIQDQKTVISAMEHDDTSGGRESNPPQKVDEEQDSQNLNGQPQSVFLKPPIRHSGLQTGRQHGQKSGDEESQMFSPKSQIISYNEYEMEFDKCINRKDLSTIPDIPNSNYESGSNDITHSDGCLNTLSSGIPLTKSKSLEETVLKCADSFCSIASLDHNVSIFGQRVDEDVTDTGFSSFGNDVSTYQQKTITTQLDDKLSKLSKSSVETIEYIGKEEEGYGVKKTCDKSVQCGGEVSKGYLAGLCGGGKSDQFHWTNKDFPYLDAKSDSFLHCGCDANLKLLKLASSLGYFTKNKSKYENCVKCKKIFSKKEGEERATLPEREQLSKHKKQRENEKRNGRIKEVQNQKRGLGKQVAVADNDYEDTAAAVVGDGDDGNDNDDNCNDDDDDDDDDCWYDIADNDADKDNNLMYRLSFKNAAPARSLTSSNSSESPRRTIFAFSPIFSLFQSALDVTNSCDPNVSDEDEEHHHIDYDSRRMKDYSFLENTRAKQPSLGVEENGETARGRHLMSFIEQLGLGNECKGDSVINGSSVRQHKKQEILSPNTNSGNPTRRANSCTSSSFTSKPRISDSFPKGKFSSRAPNNRELGKFSKMDPSKPNNLWEPGNCKSPNKVKFSTTPVNNTRDLGKFSKTDVSKPNNLWEPASCKSPIKFDSPNKTENNKGDMDIMGHGENNNFDPADTLAAASAFIGEYLYELWKNECLCDVRIRVGTKSFLAHKIVLAAFSDVFCPSEPMPNPTLMVDVPNTTSSAVFQILQYLYTSEMNITDETIEDILSAAMFLGVTDVVDLIKNILTHPTKDNISLYMDIIDRMQIPLAIPENSHLFREFLQEIWDFNVYKNLPERDIRAILSDQNIKVESETDLIVALVKWVEHDLENRQHLTPSLLKHINFVRIEPDALARTTNEYPHIFHNTECQAILAEVYKSFAILEASSDPIVPYQQQGSTGDGLIIQDNTGDGKISVMSRMSRKSSAFGQPTPAMNRRSSAFRSQTLPGENQVSPAPLSRLSQGLDLQTRAMSRQGSVYRGPSQYGRQPQAGGCANCGTGRCGCRTPPPMPKICQDLKAEGLLRSRPLCGGCGGCGACNACATCNKPRPTQALAPQSQRVGRLSMNPAVRQSGDYGDYRTTESFSQSPGTQKKFRHKDSIFIKRASGARSSYSPDMSATIMAINDQFRRASRNSRSPLGASMLRSPPISPSRALSASPSRSASRIGNLPISSSMSKNKQFRIAESKNVELAFADKSQTPPRSSRMASVSNPAQARASFKAETKDFLARQSVGRESRPQSVSPRDNARRSNTASMRASSVPRGSMRMPSHRASTLTSAMRHSTRASAMGHSPGSLRQSFRASTGNSPTSMRQSMRASMGNSPDNLRQSYRASTVNSPGSVRQSYRASAVGSPSSMRQSMRGSTIRRVSVSPPMNNAQGTLQTIDTLDETVACTSGECNISRMSQRLDYDDNRKSRSDIPVALKNPSISY